MESQGHFRFSDMNQTVRKKRSDRRPRNDTQSDFHGNSSLSSSPSDNGSKGLSDDNVVQVANYHRKELSLNPSHSVASYTNLTEAEKAPKINSEFETEESSDGRDTGVGSSFASNYKDMNTPTSDGCSSGQLEVASDAKDNVVKKVKLKVGGIVRTIHAKPSSDAAANVTESSVLKPPRCPSSSRLNQKLFAQENSDEDRSFPQEKGSGLRGIPWKDFSTSGFYVGKVASSPHSILEESKFDRHEPVRKSKRVPKRRLLDDGEDGDDDDDDEIRYLEKLKSKSLKFDDEDEVGSRKQRKISSVFKMESNNSSRLGKDRKKFKSGRDSEDTDYLDGERIYDGEPQFEFRKQGEECSDVLGGNSKRELAVTTRRQALQSGIDVSSKSSSVEFPDGLPPPPSRKQKDKLSEVEQQLKKAEASQRRKMQAEKAARESEAEAIRKILGQDSSRKKRENKIKQRQEELAQERTSNAATLASNTVRWVIGPTGTVVTFSDDMGLPNIFESRPCSYPPPREKCAGPSCNNPFKYRDSRSKLPLCSLRCYKAVQEKMGSTTVC